MPVLLLLFMAFQPARPADQLQTKVRAGMTALEKNDLLGAQANFEQATRVAPQDPRVWILLAQTYARQKNQKAAVASAQKAEALGAQNPAIIQALANFYVTQVPDFPKAASLGARYAEKSPQDVTAWRRLTAFCLKANLPEQAMAAGKRGVAVDNSAEMHRLLGQVYSERQSWPGAIAEFSAALKLNPYDEDAHFRLSQVYLLQKNYPSAIEVLLNARKFFDKSAQIELALGVAYYGERKFPDAAGQFLKTIEIAPDVPQPYQFLGRMMEHLGNRLPEATQRFAQLEKLSPNNYLGYLLHAKALILQLPAGEFPPEAETARQLLEKALALKEDDATAHYEMGSLLERRRDYAAAAAQLERSIALNPKDAAPHFRLAQVYNRLGRKEDAARERALNEKLSDTGNAAK